MRNVNSWVNVIPFPLDPVLLQFRSEVTACFSRGGRERSTCLSEGPEPVSGNPAANATMKYEETRPKRPADTQNGAGCERRLGHSCHNLDGRPAPLSCTRRPERSPQQWCTARSRGRPGGQIAREHSTNHASHQGRTSVSRSPPLRNPKQDQGRRELLGQRRRS
ncbi:hypothetical protein GN956_G17802 [Arapaima gigas]